MLLRTKFRVNQKINRPDIAEKRCSLWRPSAMLNLQNCATLSCDRPWKRVIRLSPSAYRQHTFALRSDDSRLSYSDKTIFKMVAVRHLEFSKFGILVMYPVLRRDSALSYKISR